MRTALIFTGLAAAFTIIVTLHANSAHAFESTNNIRLLTRIEKLMRYNICANRPNYHMAWILGINRHMDCDALWDEFEEESK